MKKIALILALAAANLTAEQVNMNELDGQVALLGSMGKSKANNQVQKPIESGMPIDASQAVSAYELSARMETGNRWDFSMNIAFNEYYATEDGLTVAAYGTGTSTFTPAGSVVSFDFDYHPSFQLGFTLNTPYDKWVLGSEYTWFRSSSHVSKTVGTHEILWSSIFSNTFANFLQSVSAKWKLGIDILDVYLSRPYYAGTKWTVQPFFGLRADWIRQYMHVNAVQVNSGPGQHAAAKSNAWALGPRAGFQANWLLGMGFSFFGDLSASALYTQYTTLSVKNSADGGALSKGTHNDYSALQPNLDSGMGVRWGYYTCGQRYYFDFSAAYNFSVYFSQNQMMALNSDLVVLPGTAPGNLYLHGVSLAASFLF